MQTLLLQQSECGRNGKNILVCCPYESENRFQNIDNPGQMGPSELLPNTRQCGRSFDYRISGGTTTKIDEFPWAVLIEYTKPDNDKDYICGGSLINNRYVVTAAHCVNRRTVPSGWRVTGVRLGEWDRSTDPDCEASTAGKPDCADPHLDVGIDQIIAHPNYAPQASNIHDIALIRLDRYVSFTDFISPVCLPIQSHLRSKTFDNIRMDVTGWGTTENGTTSAVKLKAVVDAWPLDRCIEKYTREIRLQNTQMCAAGQGGASACSGDSGGPLLAKERLDGGEVYVLSGIVSFGAKYCGINGWPEVYTRVGAYIDWILSALKP